MYFSKIGAQGNLMMRMRKGRPAEEQQQRC